MIITKFSQILFVSSLTAATIALAQPASAVTFNWQFTNDDGNFGTDSDVVSGFVEFSSYATYAEIANEENIPADNLQITSVTGLIETSAPFFGDGGIELNTNLINNKSKKFFTLDNEFDFNNLGEINSSFFATTSTSRATDGRFLLSEQLTLFDSGSSSLKELRELDDKEIALSEEEIAEEFVISSLAFEDSDSSSLLFSQSTTTPVNEFSSTFGLLLLGGIFAGRSYLKRRQALSITNKQ